MLLILLLNSCGVLLLNNTFMEDVSIRAYDTLYVRDNNFNSWMYISEEKVLELTANTYEVIDNTANEDLVFFVEDSGTRYYLGDIIIDPNCGGVGRVVDTTYATWSIDTTGSEDTLHFELSNPSGDLDYPTRERLEILRELIRFSYLDVKYSRLRLREATENLYSFDTYTPWYLKTEFIVSVFIIFVLSIGFCFYLEGKRK